MLETEEVDIDYFTPASNTSLAKIFNSSSLAGEDNETSLKYIPPLPKQITTKSEEKTPRECVYASALYAYEWLKDSYVSKERVGFAIIKLTELQVHNVILYNANKITLSCLTLTPEVEINVKQNVSISYYDDQRKYWNVYTNPHEFNKIIEILKNLNISLKPFIDIGKHFIADNENLNLQTCSEIPPILTTDDKENDTDASIRQKTKDSIIKRMATMGQSVLPNHITAIQTSDSSDTTSELYTQHKSKNKHRSASKRNVDKGTTDLENDGKSHLYKITTKPTYDQQLVTMHGIDVLKKTSTSDPDVNLLLSEQRVSNAELRMNMNRATDKLDNLLHRMQELQDNSGTKNDGVSCSSHFHNEVVNKLLNEYENKIKCYDEFIKLNGLELNSHILHLSEKTNKLKAQMRDNAQADTELYVDEDKEIYKLKEEITVLSNTLQRQSESNSENNLVKEVNDLRDNLAKKDEQFAYLSKQLEQIIIGDNKNNESSCKIKEIMNDTFQNIAANFDNETKYTGATIKNIVAAIIKKTTVDHLKNV